MRIGKRLEKVLSLIDEDLGLVVDVGTDHGYLALKVIEEKNAKRVIASDISVGSLKKAESLAKKYGLDNKIECVLSDGLNSFVDDFSADLVVIAGMGGNETVKILKNINDLSKFGCFILQPMQDVEVLREYLITSGFDIISDETVRDRDKFYHVIKCKFTSLRRTPTLTDLILGVTDKVVLGSDFISFMEETTKSLNERAKYLNELDKAKLELYTKILSTISKTE